MEKYLSQESIGEFFSKMYEANKGGHVEISLDLKENKIKVYNYDKFIFVDVDIINKNPDIDGLIKSLSK